MPFDYTYFNNNLLQTEVDKNSLGATVNTKTFGYNGNNQVTSAGDNNGTITTTYDNLNRVATQIGVGGFTLTWNYDTADRVTSMTDSQGGLSSYGYDNANRLTTRSFTFGTTALSVAYVYNNRNDVTEVDRYSDATQTTLVGKTIYVFDDARMVTSITHKNAAGTTIDSFNYTRDNAQNITQETSTLGPTKNYTYDTTKQLTGDGTSTYSWDANGNSTKTGYTTGTNNQLSTDGTWNYVYDNEGNTTQKTNIATGEIWNYTYDSDNRLVKAEHKPSSSGAVDLSVQFAYDVLGNRIQKTVTVGSTTTTTKFAYDADGNAWVDFTGTSTLVMRRLYGGVDQLIARIDASGVTNWYLTDNLGTVRDITGATGTLLVHADYSSFGKLTYQSTTGIVDRYSFTGRERDDELEVNYYRARYVSWTTGRFLSEDPTGFGAGDPNLYRYVFNAPSQFTDPSGKILPLLLLGGAILIFGTSVAVNSGLPNTIGEANPQLAGRSTDWYARWAHGIEGRRFNDVTFDYATSGTAVGNLRYTTRLGLGQSIGHHSSIWQYPSSRSGASIATRRNSARLGRGFQFLIIIEGGWDSTAMVISAIQAFE